MICYITYVLYREEIAAQLGLSDASSFVVVRVDLTMPEFEVGSSMKLSFADKVQLARSRLHTVTRLELKKIFTLSRVSL